MPTDSHSQTLFCSVMLAARERETLGCLSSVLALAQIYRLLLTAKAAGVVSHLSVWGGGGRIVSCRNMFCLGLKYTCLFAASLSPDSAQLRLVKDPVEMLPMQLIFFFL